MPGTIALLGAATWNTTAGTKTVVATPTVGQQIFLVTAHSGFTTTTTAPTDNNADGLGAYTVVASCLKNASADLIQIWRRNSLIGNASSTTFSHAPASTTGGGVAVIACTGVPAGATAVVQSGTQANAATGTTPTVALGAAANTANLMLGAVFTTANSSTNVTPRTGYTEVFDGGYNTPTSGLEVMTLAGGETGSSIAWGSTTASAFGAIVVEIFVTPVLQTLGWSETSYSNGTYRGVVARNAATGNRVGSLGQNKTASSTIASGDTRFSVNGSTGVTTVVAGSTFTSGEVGTVLSITWTETLAGATGSPKATVLGVLVKDIALTAGSAISPVWDTNDSYSSLYPPTVTSTAVTGESSINTAQGIRSSIGYQGSTAAKLYLKHTLTTKALNSTTGSIVVIGVASSTHPIHNLGVIPGDATVGVGTGISVRGDGLVCVDGAVINGGTALWAGMTLASADAFEFCIDPTNKKFWVAYKGTWATLCGDPAGGGAGISYTTALPDIFAYCGPGTADVITATWAPTAPTGFQNFSAGEPSSGTTYNDTLSESVAGADNSATVMTWGPAFTESVTGADSLNPAGSTYGVPLIENVTGADSPLSIMMMPNTLNEGVAVADSPVPNLVISVTVSYSVTAADGSTTIIIWGPSIIETVAAADSSSSIMTMFNALSEGVTAADSPATTVTWGTTLTESTTAAYALSSVATFPNAFTESVASADSVSSIMTMLSALSEGVTAVDSPVPNLVIGSSISYGVTAADSLTAGLTISSSLNEAVAAADNPTTTVIWGPTLGETVVAADASGTTANWVSSAAESVAANDNLTSVETFRPSITENVTAGATYSTGATTYSDTLTESLTAASSLGVGLVIASTLTESVASVASVAAVMTWGPVLTENVTANDNSTTTMIAQSSYAESLVAVVLIVSTATFPNALSEGVTASAALAAGLSISSSLNEAVATAEATASVLFAAASVTESVAATDDLTSTTVYGAALEEIVAAIDSSTSSATFVSAVVETIAASDAYISFQISSGPSVDPNSEITLDVGGRFLSADLPGRITVTISRDETVANLPSQTEADLPERQIITIASDGNDAVLSSRTTAGG